MIIIYILAILIVLIFLVVILKSKKSKSSALANFLQSSGGKSYVFIVSDLQASKIIDFFRGSLLSLGVKIKHIEKVNSEVSELTTFSIGKTVYLLPKGKNNDKKLYTSIMNELGATKEFHLPFSGILAITENGSQDIFNTSGSIGIASDYGMPLYAVCITNSECVHTIVNSIDHKNLFDALGVISESYQFGIVSAKSFDNQISLIISNLFRNAFVTTQGRSPSDVLQHIVGYNELENHIQKTVYNIVEMINKSNGVNYISLRGIFFSTCSQYEGEYRYSFLNSVFELIERERNLIYHKIPNTIKNKSYIKEATIAVISLVVGSYLLVSGLFYYNSTTQNMLACSEYTRNESYKGVGEIGPESLVRLGSINKNNNNYSMANIFHSLDYSTIKSHEKINNFVSKNVNNVYKTIYNEISLLVKNALKSEVVGKTMSKNIKESFESYYKIIEAHNLIEGSNSKIRCMHDILEMIRGQNKTIQDVFIEDNIELKNYKKICLSGYNTKEYAGNIIKTYITELRKNDPLLSSNRVNSYIVSLIESKNYEDAVYKIEQITNEINKLDTQKLSASISMSELVEAINLFNEIGYINASDKEEFLKIIEAEKDEYIAKILAISNKYTGNLYVNNSYSIDFSEDFKRMIDTNKVVVESPFYKRYRSNMERYMQSYKSYILFKVDSILTTVSSHSVLDSSIGDKIYEEIYKKTLKYLVNIELGAAWGQGSIEFDDNLPNTKKFGIAQAMIKQNGDDRYKQIISLAGSYKYPALTENMRKMVTEYTILATDRLKAQDYFNSGKTVSGDYYEYYFRELYKSSGELYMKNIEKIIIGLESFKSDSEPLIMMMNDQPFVIDQDDNKRIKYLKGVYDGLNEYKDSEASSNLGQIISFLQSAESLTIDSNIIIKSNLIVKDNYISENYQEIIKQFNIKAIEYRMSFITAKMKIFKALCNSGYKKYFPLNLKDPKRSINGSELKHIIDESIYVYDAVVKYYKNKDKYTNKYIDIAKALYNFQLVNQLILKGNGKISFEIEVSKNIANNSGIKFVTLAGVDGEPQEYVGSAVDKNIIIEVDENVMMNSASIIVGSQISHFNSYVPQQVGNLFVGNQISVTYDAPFIFQIITNHIQNGGSIDDEVFVNKYYVSVKAVNNIYDLGVGKERKEVGYVVVKFRPNKNIVNAVKAFESGINVVANFPV